MTHEEAYEIAVGAIVAWSSGRITESVARQRGTTANAVCRVAAELATEIAWQDAERREATFLDTAQGEDLSEWGADRYKVIRRGATAAVVTLEFERTDTGGVLEVPIGTSVSTPEGVQFRTDSAVAFSDGSGGPIEVEATSIEFGVDRNVDAGAIDRFTQAPPASTVTVTNPERAAGGNDPETDEQYRARVRAEFLAAGKGTLRAVRQGALSVANVREAATFEPRDPQGKQIGEVAVVIADESGGSNSALEDLVVEELDDWRAAGVYPDVFGATVEWLDVEVVVTYATGYATPASNRAVQRAIVALVNTRDPNPVDAADAPDESIATPGLVETAARIVPGVVGVDVVLPSGPVAPAKGGIVRTNDPRVRVNR